MASNIQAGSFRPSQSSPGQHIERKILAPIVEVEVKRWHGTAPDRAYGWQRMSVKEALHLQEDNFRCPECLGRVKLFKAVPEKEAVEYGEHYSKNPGCSLGDCFAGEKRQHIKPLN
jgi:hypothetical protein